MRSLILFVAAVTLAGAAVRFSTLGVQSYWADEGVTVRLMRLSLHGMLSAIPNSESTPPLYYVLAWVWAKLFGTGEWGLRSLSAVFGTATIPVAYLLGARLVSARAGAVAAALTAFSPLLVWYSQEARSYALVVLLTGLSLVLFAERRAWWWALVSILALATHYFALFAVVPCALWLLWRGGGRRIWAAVATVAVAGGALLPLAIDQASNHAADFIRVSSLGTRLLQVPKQFLVGYDSPAETPATVAAVVLAGLALVLLATRSNPREQRGAGAAAALALATGLPPVVLAALGADFVITRNLLVAWIPAAVVLAAGFAAPRARLLGTIGAGALCALGLALVIAVQSDQRYQREDWRGVARALGPAKVPRAIVVSPLGGAAGLEAYMPDVRVFPQAYLPVKQIDVAAVASRRAGHAALPPSLPRPVYAYFGLSGSHVSRTYTVFRLASVGGLARPEHPVNLNLLRLYGRQATILIETPHR
ncbi:MAG: glycosyltransferase family 39 protein [Gaiellaceae bacterium]